MFSCPVSVVIPTYNRVKQLKRALDSVIRQTRRCSEIIVVDDGSSDNTKELIEKIQLLTDLPLHYFTQQNRGPAAARNYGLRKAKYEYISFLDSDDHWHKKKLEKQYKSLTANPSFFISHTREQWLRRGLHLNQKKIHIPRQGNIYDHCLQLCAVGMSTVMVRRELFNQVGWFDETLRCCEDYDLWLRVSSRYPFLLVDEPLTIKEGGREDQVSYQYRLGMDKLRIYSLRKLLDGDSLRDDQYCLTLKEFERKVTIFGNGCIKHKNDTEGRKYLNLISVYREKVFEKFPHLMECFSG